MKATIILSVLLSSAVWAGAADTVEYLLPGVPKPTLMIEQEKRQTKESELALASAPATDSRLVLPGMRPVSVGQNAVKTRLPTQLVSDLSAVPNPYDSRPTGIDGSAFLYYTLERDATVDVTIYANEGQRVQGWTFATASLGGREGHNSVRWNGENESGVKVPAGAYFVEVIAQTSHDVMTATLKLTVIR